MHIELIADAQKTLTDLILVVNETKCQAEMECITINEHFLNMENKIVEQVNSG